MATNLQEVLGFVMTASKGERESVMQALRFAVQRDASQARMTFRPGDRVKFKSKYGSVVTGVVKKVNPKNIDLIQVETGTKWRVHPSLLGAA